MTNDREHPWRLCPSGQHWVKPYSRRSPGGKSSGNVAVHGYCARNPSKKDVIGGDEIHEIVRRHFASLRGTPKNDALGFRNGNKFDSLIRGWTRYWNKVIRPEPPLDPDLVKALIGSESSFGPKKDNGLTGKRMAVGLMQITIETLGILQNEKGELKDHEFTGLKRRDLSDPAINICAGIRWLLRKRQTASARLKRTASWEEAVAEYKDVLRRSKAKRTKIMRGFLKLYSRLKQP